MKLQLDTTLKIIKAEESVNLGELIETLERLLPCGLWKEFRLETNVTINWINPITITPFIQPYYPPVNPYPWWNPITYGTSTLNQGVYNIEI